MVFPVLPSFLDTLSTLLADGRDIENMENSFAGTSPEDSLEILPKPPEFLSGYLESYSSSEETRRLLCCFWDLLPRVGSFPMDDFLVPQIILELPLILPTCQSSWIPLSLWRLYLGTPVPSQILENLQISSIRNLSSCLLMSRFLRICLSIPIGSIPTRITRMTQSLSEVPRKVSLVLVQPGMVFSEVPRRCSASSSGDVGF
ncbi:hypothetical protein BJ322DRAFT_1114117 [Thelephora terrestris]|uniref:Uncharacterized protein n=1 Tax=Thelephora terrestris TaxID=56493 RepID=A0A9P6H6T9_9AGAM|nr:hypothetical protein BJ322DRAFT_1114117 [Thelephora terrestris]